MNKITVNWQELDSDSQNDFVNFFDYPYENVIGSDKECSTSWCMPWYSNEGEFTYESENDCFDVLECVRAYQKSVYPYLLECAIDDLQDAIEEANNSNGVFVGYDGEEYTINELIAFKYSLEQQLTNI